MITFFIAELASFELDLKGIELNPAYFHPKRIKDGIGEVHLRVLNQLRIEKRVAVTELLLQIP